MKRSVISLAFAFATALAPAAALADDAPTPQQMEAAKKAFGEGRKLHEQGKHAEAIEKFKESYRLSKNPLLLYNIAFTMDEAKEEDMALFYYRKFLKDAPPDAAQRAVVAERVKVLEQKFNPTGTPATTSTDANNANATNTANSGTPKAEPKAVVIKPPGTYSANDFEHQMVESAPPGKPLDITAFVPEDSGFVVTLNFRTAGEGKFTAKAMKWRYKELVGRVPAPKMIGNAVQYYIEVKDTEGNVVTRSGKSTSPNLINLEPGATPRFYPDLTDDGDAKLTDADVKSRDIEDDDPLHGGRKRSPDPTDPSVGGTTDPKTPGNGYFDVGSSKFKYAKLGTTIGAGAMLGLSVLFYVQAGKYATSLEDDAKSCGVPPCRMFDSYGADVESAGKRYQTLSNVAFGVGIAATAVAGYFWYKELTAKKSGERKVTNGEASASSWLVAPSVSDGFAGAAAMTRF